MAAVLSRHPTINRKLAVALGEMIEGRRAERRARERALMYRLGATNKVTKEKKQKKYVVALDGRYSAKNYTTTNQKQRPRQRGIWRGGATSGRRGGSAIPSFWGGIEFR